MSYHHLRLACTTLCAVVGLFASTAASAIDYRNIGENVIVYDGASRQATPQFILLRGTPVEVVVAVDKWVKIREAGGGLGWVEKNQVTDAKQVIVTQSTAVVRQQPEDAAPQAFSVAKDVLLEIQEKPNKAWVKVKHRDGQSGYISIKAIWGI
ncbi:SH3 domain-containing protein [Uliginosibacterium gangwonense]|uniref:SH3 domain-containing protein n=1 Tax=Uliginosibacterium gangwonense TaxID=392736 RepID=UPI0003684FE1|nr:SH3 domain-containing protein [Uliginosibacterium gangwonense]